MPWVARTLELVPKGTYADIKLERMRSEVMSVPSHTAFPRSQLHSKPCLGTRTRTSNRRDTHRIVHSPVGPSRRRIFYKRLTLNPLPSRKDVIVFPEETPFPFMIRILPSKTLRVNIIINLIIRCFCLITVSSFQRHTMGMF